MNAHITSDGAHAAAARRTDQRESLGCQANRNARLKAITLSLDWTYTAIKKQLVSARRVK